MILVTVGTEQFPFDRLIRAIDKGVKTGKISGKVFAQIGCSRYLPMSFEFLRVLSFKDLVNLLNKAEIVVTHAGVGSTLLCFNLKKIPILFPRYGSKGEHVDDHQLEFARRLERTREALVAYKEKDLLDKIQNYQQWKKKCRITPRDDTNFLNFLKEIIERKS